ncbi:MAG: DEAD/DEAH box helicase family protein [Cyanobacteria bacterium P01_E01_bin.42]
MVTKADEKALEDLIYTRLLANGYQAGNPKDFDRKFAIDTAKFWQFLEKTQPEELDKLRDRPNWQQLVLTRCDRLLNKYGILATLKKGIDIDAAHLTLYYCQPYNDLNPKITADFEENIFSVSRQIHHSQETGQKSIDLVLFLNGLAIATIELKNPHTGQTVYHAKKQYCDRDPRVTLLQFTRCIVHFAVDPNEVWMTTQLNGKNTFFLPFNKGHHHGKGNPPNPDGHKTAYLWEEILPRESFADILEKFAILIPDRDDKNKKTLFFPRYHQLDVVRKLLHHAETHGSGQTYLIQHSAGSGKSNSITWTAYQLIELYPPGRDSPLFDSVIVVTDRRNLDKQIRNTIKSFSQIKNIIAPAYRSRDLKTALESGKKIIITTIQKFPFIVDGIEDLSDRTFAVIIDEAHSSQSGEAADTLNATLNSDASEEPEDVQDLVLQAISRRKLSPNASYFAFTATPKNTTLEKFGTEQPDGSFAPFHLYSMKQAIEEGFILDVLANYTTYRSYYEIQKAVEENPLFDTAKAQKKLRAYVETHETTIAAKAEVMLNHFIERVWQPKKLKGQAKAMIVTQNIETAIRYFFAIRDAIARLNLPWGAIVAFSGKKSLDGNEYSEDLLNNFPSKDIPEKFKSDPYKILIVANKFLTGFDEPLLHTMYVDKKLQSVLAVQTLSRLNRCNPKMGKQDTFVLDFYNTVDDIRTAFDPFYTATTLSERTDPNALHDIKNDLDDTGIYDWHEVETFCDRFFNNTPPDQLSPLLDTASDRFNWELDLEEAEKIDFKIKAKQFVKIYGQLACLLHFNNPNWEQLYWFLKFLIPKLLIRNPDRDRLDQLLESVDLSTYGLERVQLNAQIELNEEESEIDPQNPNPRCYREDNPQEDPLDAIVAAFNIRHFSGWDASPAEQRIKLLNIARQVSKHPDYARRVSQNPDEQNRRLAIEGFIKKAVQQEGRRDMSLYRTYASDPDFVRALNLSVMKLLLDTDPADLDSLFAG